MERPNTSRTAAEPSTSLNSRRRQRELEQLSARSDVDVLVVGGGVTGAGTALDAAARGLSVVLVEKHDLAFGTSRWSSKLVHGGLRYLIAGHPGVAMESAVERDILFRHTAPHLVRAQPSLMPKLPQTPRTVTAVSQGALLAGDALRRLAGTRGSVLPHSRRVGRSEALHLAPGLTGVVSGGLLGWDGQLVDDARLVVALARTAAGHGARVITRCSAQALTGREALLRDELTGEEFRVRARAVINATGVWAGELDDQVRLRPSRGTHLVLRSTDTIGGLRSCLTLPVPGELSQFVLVMPQLDGRVYVGLTDEPADGTIPDVPQPTEPEIDFLLETVNRALRTPIARADVAGAFAGLRPLLDTGSRRTSDLSRRHTVLTSKTGVITIVGGKLTTYRRMAEDAVDTAVRLSGLDAAPCPTRRLPLVGAGTTAELARLAAPRRLIERYGTEALTLMREARAEPAQGEPVAEGQQVTAAELRFGVLHEGALDTGDLLHRRTRIGLIPEDVAKALPAAQRVLEETDEVVT